VPTQRSESVTDIIEAHRTDLSRLAAMTLGVSVVLVATPGGITAPRMNASAHNTQAVRAPKLSTAPKVHFDRPTIIKEWGLHLGAVTSEGGAARGSGLPELLCRVAGLVRRGWEVPGLP